ncbi:MMPL family transporter [Marihabitans asiaticum]|uniref:RND superfamily putative drug exporter n=1 Tax=Marihabitans asiaticum TaxID=415218 RepID=A0A560WE06_9MICO|nr:MMPL family transporter [Marihabitans asiaticum]TWD15901.1 RND superfamily putative drug exporter [Marihabitans asiaticum]
MAHALYRLGKTAYRRWPVVFAVWLALIVGLGAIAATQSKPMVDKFTIPGIPSEQAQDLQNELFPGSGDALEEASATVVVAAPEGEKLSDPENQEAVQALIGELRQLPQLDEQTAQTQLVPPTQAAAGLEKQLQEAAQENGTPPEAVQQNLKAISPLSEDGRIGTMTFTFDVDSVVDVEESTREEFKAALETARDAGLQAEANGSAMQGIPETGGTSELIGIAFALLVLVLTFGSLVAAGMPILTALVGVGIGIMGVSIATIFTDIGTTTPILATMLGLAVGIDYSLFILSRYRAELRHADREEAIGLAVGRAGSAVVFAGLTVIIALSAFAVVRISFLTSMGLAAAGTVLVAVLVALTLLPAFMGMLGGKAFAGRVRKDHMITEGEVVNNGVRWARWLQRAPLLVALAVVLGLGALAVPAKDIHLALPTDSTAEPDTTMRKAADLVTEGFGEGRQAPFLVVVDAREIADENPQTAAQAFGVVTQWAAEQDGVANAQVAQVNEEGTGAQLLVTPTTGAADEATEELLTTLRDGQADIEQRTGTTVGVTGLTAIQTDVSDRLLGALVPYLAIVVGLAFLLLMMVFRSILVPLTATIGFLGSVLATLGATVLVFQEGLFGLVEPAPLMSFLPMLIVGIVFGLAMDYQVFLVTRMREAYVHGDTATDAVVDGFRFGSRVVTAAAAIMISVFAAFMLQDDTLVKSIGFALAVAVFFDAFLVRQVFIPAVMYLMGDRAWWLPRWLDRVLPDVDVEGESLAREGSEKESPAEGETKGRHVPRHAK